MYAFPKDHYNRRGAVDFSALTNHWHIGRPVTVFPMSPDPKDFANGTTLASKALAEVKFCNRDKRLLGVALSEVRNRAEYALDDCRQQIRWIPAPMLGMANGVLTIRWPGYEDLKSESQIVFHDNAGEFLSIQSLAIQVADAWKNFFIMHHNALHAAGYRVGSAHPEISLEQLRITSIWSNDGVYWETQMAFVHDL